MNNDLPVTGSNPALAVEIPWERRLVAKWCRIEAANIRRYIAHCRRANRRNHVFEREVERFINVLKRHEQEWEEEAKK